MCGVCARQFRCGPSAAGKAVADNPAMKPVHVAGLFAGVAVLIFFQVAPPPPPITELGMARLGLLAFGVIWWLATPLPLAMTTLAMLALGVGTGALTVAGAFAHSGSWVLWFVIGTFGLAAALETAGVNRRVALGFLDVRWARGRSRRFLVMFFLSATVMSAFMANTVVSLIWLSLAKKIYRLLGVPNDEPLVEANTLGIAWAANIGGVATPVGNGTNVVAIGMIATATGVTVSFMQWTLVGSALALVFITSAIVWFWFGAARRSKALDRPDMVAFISQERAGLGPMSIVEKWAISWFAFAILLWFLPDLSALVMPGPVSQWLQKSLHMSVPAILAPIAMCLAPIPGAPGKRVLDWQSWMSGTDWALLLFVGGVMGIGNAVGEDITGIPAYVRIAIEPLLSGLSEYTFVLVMALGVIAVTNVISNMVTLAIFLPLGLTMAKALGVADPVALGLVLAVGPSLAYALPSGTTTNAIVAGSGYLRVSTMLRNGIPLCILHALLLTYVGYPLAKLVMGR